jgi:hypothetical protein
MSTGKSSSRSGAKRSDARAKALRFAGDRLVVLLADQREVSVPISWYPSLHRATDAERAQYKLLNGGKAFHWPNLDLDLSLAGVVAGLPEVIPAPPNLVRTTRRSA